MRSLISSLQNLLEEFKTDSTVQQIQISGFSPYIINLPILCSNLICLQLRVFLSCFTDRHDRFSLHKTLLGTRRYPGLNRQRTAQIIQCPISNNVEQPTLVFYFSVLKTRVNTTRSQLQ